MPSLHGATEVATRESRELAPIRIFTDLIELTGRVAPAGQRITDILLRGQDLAFLPAGADPEPETWILIAPTDILFVSPPPMAPRAIGRASPSVHGGRADVLRRDDVASTEVAADGPIGR